MIIRYLQKRIHTAKYIVRKAMILSKRKRIRDATLHTFIYHYIFAAKSKSLII